MNKKIGLKEAIFCFVAMVALLVQHYSESKTDVYIALGIIIGSFLIEYLYKKNREKSENNIT